MLLVESTSHLLLKFSLCKDLNMEKCFIPSTVNLVEGCTQLHWLVRIPE